MFLGLAGSALRLRVTVRALNYNGESGEIFQGPLMGFVLYLLLEHVRVICFTRKGAEYHGRELPMQMVIKRVPAISIGLRITMIVTLLLATCSLPHAQEGTFAQREACKPDVFRLCSEFIPNRPAITECLQRNLRRLSEACRAVFEGRLK